ncbi:proline-rich transmembrane protein 1-like [Oryzias latipes]|uniref:proline-rich transmembrane protein 1-like n=1 Tax=Oryzias latipes TaxID=8090 RepID=UPI0005CC2320|nr:proline-rich transmembrane protein 1-like [Oryzias latipes]
MDLNKSASAPPVEWNDEKMPMVHNLLPPPYQDMPHQGPSPSGHPPPQAFGYPAQYAGAGYHQQPGFMNQQPPAQPGIVTVQPTVYVTQAPLGNPVSDYMCYSIFTMLCCCLPLGIAALIYSINAREANISGNRVRAESNSRTAKTLNHVALGIGLVLIIAYIAVINS